MDRDPSAGTALQEVNFWLNVERALLKTQEKLETQEVQLTMDILKHGKRFHATVSFESDTGLKQALELVKDYNVLMRDFPVNELTMQHDELPAICASLPVVFGHLRKVRLTKYPLSRLFKLCEAISRDLCALMLRTLANKRLMLVSYETFETHMSHAHAIFACWDDEHEKLATVVKDMTRKKSTVTLAPSLSTGGAQLAHKTLQARLEHLRRWDFSLFLLG